MRLKLANDGLVYVCDRAILSPVQVDAIPR